MSWMHHPTDMTASSEAWLVVGTGLGGVARLEESAAVAWIDRGPTFAALLLQGN